MKMKKTFMMLLLSVACCSACLRQDELRGLDNYMEFDTLRAEYGKPTMHLTFGPKLLWLAGLFTGGDEEFSDLVSHINTVRIVSYRVNRNPLPALNAVRDAATKLEARDWEPVVVVSDEDEQTRILIKVGADTIDGIVVMSVDRNDEAVFINVTGKLTPAQLSKFTRGMNFDENI